LDHSNELATIPMTLQHRGTIIARVFWQSVFWQGVFSGQLRPPVGHAPSLTSRLKAFDPTG
jgi:hypothetical protein